MALSIAEVKEMYETGVERMFPRWKDMLLCYDMLAGRQYDKEEQGYHERWKIAMRTMNMLHSSMVTVDGVAIGNSPRGKAWPVEPGDVQVADVLTETVQDALRHAKAQYEQQRVLTDAAIAGWGFEYIGFRRSQYFKDGEATVDRLNGFDVLMDLDDENPSIRKDRWRGISRWGAGTFFQESWGGYDPSVRERIDAALIDKLGSPEEVEKYKRTFYSALKRAVSNMSKVVQRVRGVRSDYDPDARMRDWIDTQAAMFRGVEIHYKTNSSRWAIADPMQTEPIQIPEEYQAGVDMLQGGELDPDSEEADVQSAFVIQSALGKLGLQPGEDTLIQVPYEEWRVCAAVPGLVEDDVLFDVPYTVQGHGCAIKVLEAFDFDPRKNERISLIKLAIDAQRRLNRSMSLIEETLKRRMFPDWLVPKGSIKQEDLPTWKANAMGRMLEYSLEAAQAAAGALPQRLDPPNVEGIIMQDFSLNMDLIPRLIGVPTALGGEKDARKDGADLYQSMVAQGQTMIKPLLHKFEQFFIETAQFVLAMIQRHYTAERYIRLTGKSGLVGEDGGFYINSWDYQQDRPVNDIDTGRYDVVIDTQVLSPVEREAKFVQRMNVLAAFDPMFRDFSMPELLELSGWADAPDLLRKWRVKIIVQYAPFGEQLLAMLEDEDAFTQNLQNGTIGMIAAQLKAQQASAMGAGPQGAGPQGGGDLEDARAGMGMRDAYQAGQQPVSPGGQGQAQIMDSVMRAGNYPGGM